MIAIQKKIVMNESGAPKEVVIPWAQFCELSEALGLDEKAAADLRQTRSDFEKGRYDGVYAAL